MASATATRYGLSRGLLGLKYDQINYSDSDSDSDLIGTDESGRMSYVMTVHAIIMTMCTGCINMCPRCNWFNMRELS